MAYRCPVETTVAQRAAGRRCVVYYLLAAVGVSLIADRAVAQFSAAPPSDLSEAVQVDEASSAARTMLERAKAHAAEKQWDEAIETLRQVMERDGDKVVHSDSRHFITVREFGHRRLAEMSPEGRALYRSRVDSLAQRWYRQGVADRDATLLRRVVDQFFVSSSGDVALMALGEIALERGDYQEARWCWERISPELRSPDGQPLWLGLKSAAGDGPLTARESRPTATNGAPPTRGWLAYPDTKLNLADVRARLVLTSIMEGALVRARVELADFNRRHPEAKGRMAGRDGPYSETLSRLLATAESRPSPPPIRDWTTFGGSVERTAIAEEPKSLGHRLWEIPLDEGKPFKADVNSLEIVRRSSHWLGLPQFRRTADDNQALLSYYPLVAGNLVLFNTVEKVFAFDLRTGKPAWPVKPRPGLDALGRLPGEIYSGLKDQEKSLDPGEGLLFPAFGAPRFTMTVKGSRLYARLGSPITGHPAEAASAGSSYLVCLDLAAEGLLIWRAASETAQDERWAFEGPPIADGNNVFVVMRYNDVRPQVHVACLDARTGALRWRKLICTNETVAGGKCAEITSNLLTLAGETLYLNTNLGAVAALSADDGEIRWISGYPRAKAEEPNAAHFYRDLNPCIYCRGSLFVAPTDSPDIFALDAATGQLLWECRHFPETIHLLGVGGNNLIASGKQICWLDIDSGKVIRDWPDKTSGGFGRGVLAGELVYWPMRNQIRRFKQRVLNDGPLDSDDAIQLDRFDPPLSGGNLIAANGYLLIASSTKLTAFGPGQAEPRPEQRILTQSTTKASGATKKRFASDAAK
jgi:outer membrane protein assembly factor BamB